MVEEFELTIEEFPATTTTTTTTNSFDDNDVVSRHIAYETLPEKEKEERKKETEKEGMETASAVQGVDPIEESVIDEVVLLAVM